MLQVVPLPVLLLVLLLLLLALLVGHACAYHPQASQVV